VFVNTGNYIKCKSVRIEQTDDDLTALHNFTIELCNKTAH